MHISIHVHTCIHMYFIMYVDTYIENSIERSPIKLHVSIVNANFCYHRTGCSSLPYQRDATTIFGVTHRDHRGIARSNQWSDDGTLWCLLRKELLFPLRSLWEEMLSWMQGRPYGHPQTWNNAYQLAGKHYTYI